MQKEKKFKIPTRYYPVLVLLFLNVLIWAFYFSLGEGDILTVSFLDVGQGDSIFVEAPNGKQILIDAGRDAGVLNELGRVMGFFDRSIDIVLATHPDQDHIGGLPLIFERYKILNFIESPADGETNTYRELENNIETENSEYFVGMRGTVIVLDKTSGVYLHVLYPGPDEFEIDETNDLSIIVKLIYGDTSFMLTGDAGKIPELMLYSTDKNYLKSSVLKAGHHGSKTSSSPTFVKTVGAQYVVISAGKDNSYGHPHPQVLETFENYGAEILETSKEGTITFESNGLDIWEK